MKITKNLLTPEAQFRVKLFLLKMYYKKIIEILDAFKSGCVLIEDDRLNHYYVRLIIIIENILNDHKFEEINEKSPYIYRSLLGELQEIDFSWEVVRGHAMGFLAEIDKQCILRQVPNYKLPIELTDSIKWIDDAILEHKETVIKESTILKKRAAEDFEKNKESSEKEIKKTNKFPHKLPAGTKWENFIIKFVDDKNVFIQVMQYKHTANYKEMGFIGRGKDPRPSEAWILLKTLSTLNGEIDIRDREAKEKYKKQKEFLAEILQNYFSLDYDPFYPYHSSSEKSGNSYKIKITLIPPPDQKRGINKHEREATDNNDKKYSDLDDVYKELTPKIYDKYNNS